MLQMITKFHILIILTLVVSVCNANSPMDRIDILQQKPIDFLDYNGLLDAVPSEKEINKMNVRV